jgi:hypothetical protein
MARAGLGQTWTRLFANDFDRKTGDGVVVPVVRHLAEHAFEPLLAANPQVATGATEPPRRPGKAALALPDGA